MPSLHVHCIKLVKHLNEICKSHILLRHCRDQRVNAIRGSNCCLFWESYELYTYTLWAKCRDSEYLHFNWLTITNTEIFWNKHCFGCSTLCLHSSV